MMTLAMAPAMKPRMMDQMICNMRIGRFDLSDDYDLDLPDRSDDVDVVGLRSFVQQEIGHHPGGEI